MIKIEDLEKIIDIVENHDISHFEFEQDSSRVVIEKDTPRKMGRSMTSSCKKEILLDSLKDKRVEKNNGKVQKDDFNCKEYIKSTLAGTFYIKKDEGSEPFVSVNDEVDEETIVGLIEVMKLFNEIEAGVKGKITKILVKDGDFVEYGQPLFEIEQYMLD